MMTGESSANSEHKEPISHGLKIHVCASASNKVQNGIHQRYCVSSTIKRFKRPPILGNGKLATGANSLRKPTESGRAAKYAAH